MFVVFRTDASAKLGNGHLYRCVSLAQELLQNKNRIHFICNSDARELKELFSINGIGASFLKKESFDSTEIDANETILAIQGLGEKPDCLVIDHYQIDSSWETQLRPFVKKILVIDDLANRSHNCDILLDQNYHGVDHEKRYKDLVNPRTLLLLGPRYALLQQQFSIQRSLTPRKPATSKEKYKILVFFGGTDPPNETCRVIKALDTISHLISLYVVTGKNNPKKNHVEKLCASRPWCKFLCNIKDMASLLLKCDLSVSAGGSFTWERFCLGLPGVVTSIASNQEHISELLARDGYILFLGNYEKVKETDYINAVATMIHSPWLREFQAQRGQELVDGLGAKRVANIIDTPHITLRPSTLEDCKSVHEWRNMEINRRYSFVSEPIEYGEHEKWFREVLASENRELLIAEVNDRPLGVIRYDIEGNEALLSVYLVPGMHGQGLGSHLIRMGSRWLSENHPKVEKILAQVLPSNTAARKVFMSAGFKEKYRVFEQIIR